MVVLILREVCVELDFLLQGYLTDEKTHPPRTLL